jgi:AcrR family transcriptional regulator
MPDEERLAVFLETLSETGHVTKSAAAAGIPRRTVYNWRRDDEGFRQQWDEAAELGTDALVDEAVRRGKDGTLRPVYQRGKEVGTIREFSDTLLIFLLKARRPEYRDTARVQVAGDPVNPIQHEHSGTITIAAKLALFRERYGAADAAGVSRADGGPQPPDPAPAQPPADPLPRT